MQGPLYWFKRLILSCDVVVASVRQMKEDAPMCHNQEIRVYMILHVAGQVRSRLRGECSAMSHSCHRWGWTAPGSGSFFCHHPTPAHTENTGAQRSCPCLQCPLCPQLREEEADDQSESLFSKEFYTEVINSNSVLHAQSRLGQLLPCMLIH